VVDRRDGSGLSVDADVNTGTDVRTQPIAAVERLPR